MAELFEDSTNDELQEFDSVDNLAKAEPTKVEQKQDADDDVPEKFKGKSVKDITNAYAELEKLNGRQAQEVGELRKLTDQILKNQIEAAKKEDPQAQEVNFFDDPVGSVSKVVENHPALIEAQKTAALLRAKEVRETLEKKHGNLDSYATDPDFINYVKASKVRMALMSAAENFDFDAADELLSTYKEISAVKTAKSQEQVEEIKQKQQQSLKAGSVVMSSGTGESSKKVYRRADLIRLKMQDPQRYEALNDEITAAYQEGRVK